MLIEFPARAKRVVRSLREFRRRAGLLYKSTVGTDLFGSLRSLNGGSMNWKPRSRGNAALRLVAREPRWRAADVPGSALLETLEEVRDIFGDGKSGVTAREEFDVSGHPR